MNMFFDPFQEFDRLANAMFRGAGVAAMPVDLFRERDHYVLNADLPGVDPRSVDVSVDGQTLTIRAERAVDAIEGAEWLARERPQFSLVRQFSLGDGVDADRITAAYQHGVLSLVIPVREEAKPRKIEVTSARPIEAGRSKSAGQDEAESVVGTDQETVA